MSASIVIVFTLVITLLAVLLIAAAAPCKGPGLLDFDYVGKEKGESLDSPLNS